MIPGVIAAVAAGGAEQVEEEPTSGDASGTSGFTNFSEYEPGKGVPADWTLVGSNSVDEANVEIIEASGFLGDKILRIPIDAPTNDVALYWDDPASFDQGEVLAKVRVASIIDNSRALGPGMRMAGSAADDSDLDAIGAVIRRDGSSNIRLDVFEGENGTPGIDSQTIVSIDPTDWHWIRLQMDGADSYKAKVWQDGDAEPESWTVDDAFTSALSASGKPGVTSVQSIRNADHDVDYLAFTQDPDGFPLEVPAEPTPSVSTVTRTTDGLVFRDRFNRADSTSLGGSWVEVDSFWEILNNQLRSSHDGNTQQNVDAEHPVSPGDDFIVQTNFRVDKAETRQVMRIEDDGGNGLVNVPKPSNDPAWRLFEGNVGQIDSFDETIPINAWHTQRIVYAAAENRAKVLRLLSIADSEDLSGDPTEIMNATLGSAIADLTTLQFRSGIDAPLETAEFLYDEAFICGRNITVDGVPDGWKVQVNSRTAVVSDGGPVEIDVDAWALPATTVKILDDSDVEQASVTPSGGVWGGDVYEASE